MAVGAVLGFPAYRTFRLRGRRTDTTIRVIVAVAAILRSSIKVGRLQLPF